MYFLQFEGNPACVLVGKGAVEVVDADFVVERLLVDACFVDGFGVVVDVEIEIETPMQ